MVFRSGFDFALGLNLYRDQIKFDPFFITRSYNFT